MFHNILVAYDDSPSSRAAAQQALEFAKANNDGIQVIRTSVQAPNANAFAGRWVRTMRADCLDRIFILGRRHLEHVLHGYRRHYNEHRPHRALELLPPDGGDRAPLNTAPCLHRRDLLGGIRGRLSLRTLRARSAAAAQLRPTSCRRDRARSPTPP
jgi:hypothetical protein